MPDASFRGDPYQVLEVSRDAPIAQIRRRWRELAREHHPDRAAGDEPEVDRLTTRMARINAAYDLLRDPIRRARYDASPAARRAREASRTTATGGGFATDADRASASDGPPPPPPTRPVNARYDTTAAFRPRNTTTSTRRPDLQGQPPIDRRSRDEEPQDPRASTPTGPVRRRASTRAPHPPALADAREALLEFGRFRGFTLGEVAEMEPTYIDWIARTITRDRDLVVSARVVQADLDERGVDREIRPPRPGFGNPRESSTADASMGR